MKTYTYDEQCTYNVPFYCIYSALNSVEHLHSDFYEFCLFTNGSYRSIRDNSVTICRTGHLLFFRPGEAHSLEINESNATHYAFIVKKSFFEEYFHTYCSQRNIKKEISDIPTYISKELSGFQLTYLSQLASAVAYTTSSKHRTINLHFFDTLLFTCLESIPTGTYFGVDLYASDLRRRFDNYHSLDTEITTLYNDYPIASCTLSNQFKKITGYTIVEYRNMKRIEYAAHLLIKENYQITEVANIVNIPNLSYFAKQFKKQFGMSPKQYQKKNHRI